MRVFRTIAELREAIKQAKQETDPRVGVVPTMGYLHDGHASLLRKAREECGTVVLSIFINPLQFGPNEDFERYPRDEERDVRLAEAAGADIAFIPTVAEMYPQPIKTTVSVSGDVTDKLCGAARPGHFEGVATVVSKLFHIVEPDRAYFGMKDAQQVAVIQQMVSDLSMNVTVVPCPTVREDDGLAKSSRNVFLSEEERRQALVLSEALRLSGGWLQELSVPEAKKRIAAHIRTSPLAVIDYVEILTYPSLEKVSDNPDPQRRPDKLIVALAVKFGKTRLIDNRLFDIHELSQLKEGAACSGRS